MSRATDQHIGSLKDERDFLRQRVTELETINRDLLAQIQANVQGFGHVPMVQSPPVDPTAPVGYDYDETGLIASPIYADEAHEYLPDADV